MKSIPCAIALFLLGATTLLAENPTAPLKVGDSIPDVTLRDESSKEVALRQMAAEKPTVLIFYRGGWCPFCSRHLQSLATIQDDIAKAGAQLVAISMDSPAKLKTTPDRDKLPYRLLSDSQAKAAKAFGIAFTVDDETINTYKKYGIDLEVTSGEKHHMLPHPAVYIADKAGRIRFAHVNTDYKVRLEPAKVLEALASAK